MTPKPTQASEARFNFPWISRAQSFVIEQRAEQFFGFDADERPVFSRSDGLGLDAIMRGGGVDVVHPPVRRHYLHAGEFEITAVVKMKFKITTEFGTDEEVEKRVRASSRIRNRIVRKLEDALCVGDIFTSYVVGGLDEHRELEIDAQSARFTVRGIGVENE